VQLILLDLRWNKTEVKPPGGSFAKATKYLAGFFSGSGVRGAYTPIRDDEATLLGAAQWRWLEEQMQVPADLRIIGSSLQVLSRGTGWEAWDLFPKEQARFEALIGKAENVVLISGDVHYAEITRAEREGAAPLRELTSSGLTEVWSNLPPNDRRASAWRGRNFGMIEVNWTAGEVTLSARDETGRVRLSETLAFAPA
jgi:alkaline phosphatase D